MSDIISKDETGIITAKPALPFGTAQAQAFIQELQEELNKSKNNRVLTDIRSMTEIPSIDSIKIIAKGIKNNKTLISKSAVITSNAAIKKALQGVLLFTGRHDIKLFTSKNEAIDWLNRPIEGTDEEDVAFDLLISLIEAPAALKTEEKTSSNNIKKVLIIEDNEAILNIYKKIVEHKFENVKVYTAENGKIALQYAEDFTMDFIMSDLMIPEVSGWDVIQTIRRDPRHKNIPILVISAAGDKDGVVKAMKAGATDFMLKPPPQKSPHRKNRRLPGDTTKKLTGYKLF